MGEGRDTEYDFERQLQSLEFCARLFWVLLASLPPFPQLSRGSYVVNMIREVRKRLSKTTYVTIFDKERSSVSQTQYIVPLRSC